MRRVIQIIFFLLPFVMQAQVRIQMEKSGDVYKIPCLVNGVKMKMIFDTGASRVSISSMMADYLYENDYISVDDVKGYTKTRIADGSIKENMVVCLKSVEIGGLILRDVEAVVSKSLDAPLLLGQSAIQKLGSITLEGNTLIINNGQTEFSEEETDSWAQSSLEMYHKENYNACLIFLDKLRQAHCLSASGYRMYVVCLVMERRDVTEIGEEFITTCDLEEDVEATGFIFKWMGESYNKSGNFEKAKNMLFKSLAFSERVEDYSTMGAAYSAIGDVYDEQDKYYDALASYDKSIDAYSKIENRSDIVNKMIGHLYIRKAQIKRALNNYKVNAEIEGLYKKAYSLGVKDALDELAEWKAME